MRSKAQPYFAPTRLDDPTTNQNTKMISKNLTFAAIAAGLLALASTAMAAIPADGTYCIVNRATGMYLDSYGSSVDGSGARQYTRSGWAAQYWTLTTGSGYWTLNDPSVVGSMYLDDAGNTSVGSPCLIWEYSGSINQEWNIIDLGNGYYQIQNQANGLYLDDQGSTTDGTTNVFQTNTGNNSQQWQFVLFAPNTAFVHPGLLHTSSDFSRMTAEVNSNANPWIQGWQKLTNNSHAKSTWVPNPQGDIDRGGTLNNYGIFYNDVAAAYQNALEWAVSGNTANGDTAVNILTAWANTCTNVTGDSDRFLAYGIYGYEYCQAAEIMRSYSGFSSAQLAACQNFMQNVFAPGNVIFLENHNTACISNYWANWDLCNIASLAAIGVLCDNRTYYQFALNYFTNANFLVTGAGNGEIDHTVPYLYSGTPTLGQGQEEGRDQGHSGLDVSLWGVVCQQFYNQGDDMFAFQTNKILAACEYFADYNISTNNTVPYTTYNYGSGQNCAPQSQTVVSSNSRGDTRPAWELIYSHYAGVAGQYAPYSTAYAAIVRPEGGGGNYGSTSGGYDQLGFGTLAYTVTAGNPIASGYYLIKNRADGNVVDDYGYQTNGAPCNQYAQSGSANQTWYLQQISGSTYTIKGVSNNGMLIDSLGHTANGSTAGQWQSSSSNNQKWNITSVGGGYYKITNVANGKCLDTGGLTNNGATLQFWGSGGSYNQQWSFLAPP